MGLRFRKSFSLRGLRLNISRSGVGSSWGLPGIRFGITADGRRYVALGLPGTGLYYMKYFGRWSSSLLENAVVLLTSDRR